MKRGSGCCAIDIYCTATLTSLLDSVSYITFLFRNGVYDNVTGAVDFRGKRTSKDGMPAERVYLDKTCFTASKDIDIPAIYSYGAPYLPKFTYCKYILAIFKYIF